MGNSPRRKPHIFSECVEDTSATVESELLVLLLQQQSPRGRRACGQIIRNRKQLMEEGSKAERLLIKRENNWPRTNSCGKSRRTQKKLLS